MAVARPCAEPGCGNYATYKGRCPDHAAVRIRSLKNRDSLKIYATKRWKIAKRQQLFFVPLCEHEGCDKVATDVHHRVDLTEGGDPFDRANLESLCHGHHSQITRRGQLRIRSYEETWGDGMAA